MSFLYASIRTADIKFKVEDVIVATYRIEDIVARTDGARLSFESLPCPNIFAGGHNFHSRFEYLPINSLKKSQETIVNIVKILAQG